MCGVRMIVIFVTIAFGFIGQWTLLGDEISDALIETTGWCIPIRSHDVEITLRETTSTGGGSKRQERVRIIREVYDRDLNRFLMCNAVGSWSLELTTGQTFDGGKIAFIEGNDKSAIRHVEGYGVSNMSSNTGLCLTGARGMDLWMLPLTFVHAAGAEIETRDFLVEFISQNEQNAKVEEISRSHFGKVKKQKRFRFYKEYTNAVGRIPVGIELCISSEGSDIGFVTELRLCFLKPNSTKFEVDSDISYCQCSVRTKWEELEKTDLTIVPVEVDQQFLDGDHAIGKSTKLAWKHLNHNKSSDDSVTAKSTLEEFKTSVGNVKARVDKLLNR